MKKFLPLLTLCMGLCCVSCYDDSPILERLDALEKNAIASINEQISAIKSSITSLEAVDKELKATIQTLEAKDASQQEEIDKLKEANASLETKIGELKTYVDEEISNTEDWATATFATLEQYDSLCVVLTGIETSISDLKEEFTKNLSDAISNSEESMKGWVNEQLTGYWTIAETQARLDTLKQTQTEEIEKLSTDLADAKEEMTEAYTTAISTAIEELDGKLSDEITKINDELTKRMDDIEDRLSTIEETLKNLTRDFSISFDDYDIGILAGGTTSVGYTITGTTEKTTVKALGQNGWSAKVTPDGIDKGKITVTAPNPLTEDEIIVLVYDGEYRTIMSSINFVTGVVTPSQTAVELDAEAGIVDITVTSNLNYKVSIPEDAKDWLSVVETKSTKTETITFAYTANEFSIRRAEVSFVDDADNIITQVSIIQQGSATEVTLSEAGKLLEAIGENVYQSLKALIIHGPINGTDILWINRMSKLTKLDLSDASIVAGGVSYKDGYSTKDNTITGWMFADFGVWGEYGHIILPKNIIKVEGFAFTSNAINKVELPNSLKVIGNNAFYNCSSLDGVELPEFLEEIGELAFNDGKIKSLTIPQTVKKIKSNALRFDDITEIRLQTNPDTLIGIGSDIFTYNVYENAILYIPKGTKQTFLLTDFGRFKNIIEE